MSIFERSRPQEAGSGNGATGTDVRPFHVEVPEAELAELRRRIEATRWPSAELVADRSQGVQLATHAGARPLLGDRVRLAQGRGEAERAAAVHDRDQRRRDPLHPRPVAARGRDAADHDPRLARLGHRAAGHHRPADRPDRSRRHAPRTRSTSCCRPCPATASRASRPSSAGRTAAIAQRVGGADEAPRLHALRRPGRRRGRRRHRRDGPPGTRRAARHPRQPARAGDRPQGRPAGGVRAGARGARRRSRRSRRTASATSSSRPPGRRRSATRCWTRRSGWRPGCSTTTPTATTRSRARSSTASPSGNLTRDNILDNITLYWLTGTGASAARWYWEFGRFLAATARPGAPAGHGPGRLHDVPRRDLGRPAQLGRGRLPRRRVPPRGRPRRPLRRLGGAGALLHRGASRVQLAALTSQVRGAQCPHMPPSRTAGCARHRWPARRPSFCLAIRGAS